MSEKNTKKKTFEELKNIIREKPTKGELMDLVRIAKDFIKKELSSFEQEDAEMFIKYFMSDYFLFKNSVSNDLMKYYRECRNAYLKEETDDPYRKTLPEWYKITDKGLKFLPGRLVEHLTQTENIIFVNGEYYQYQNGVYARSTKDKIQRLIRGKMLKDEISIYHIHDTEEQLKLSVYHDPEEINPDPYIINVQNGLYDLKTDTFLSHDPGFLSTIQIRANYNEDAKCPKFGNFLFESTNGDFAQIGLLQETVGYSLIPVTLAQKCFILLGKAASGKSLFLNVIQDILLDRQNVSNVAWQDLPKPFRLAELDGKLVNIHSDIPDAGLSENGPFKVLVGGDSSTVDKKFQPPFNFKATARLLFSCNRLPQNQGDNSDAFYRRLLIIPFNHSVPQEKRNPFLFDEFKEEADGIFMFALKGLKRLIANNFVFSETDVNRNELQKYRKKGNSVIAFVQDCCELDFEGQIGTEELHKAYMTYCLDNGHKDYAINTFVSQLMANFSEIERFRDSKRRGFKGIKLKSN